MKPVSPSQNKKSGFILISVMFTVTLLITAATAFAWFARNEAHRMTSEIYMAQTERVAEIAAARAKKLLAKDTNSYDSFKEDLYTSKGIQYYSVGEYKAEVHFRPLNDKIDINEVLLPDRVTPRGEYTYAWEEIWRKVEHSELSDIVLDFFDYDKKQRPGGREDDICINREISDLSELLLVPELNRDILSGITERDKRVPGLTHFFTVTGGQKININTASQEVIAVLDDKIGEAGASSVAAYRELYPIKDMTDLENIAGIPSGVLKRLTNVIAFKSSFVELTIFVTDDRSKRTRKFVLIADKSSGRTVTWRE